MKFFRRNTRFSPTVRRGVGPGANSLAQSGGLLSDVARPAFPARDDWKSGWRWRARLPASKTRSGDETGKPRDRRLQRLEAVLFVAREPLTSRKLSQFANLADGTEARTLIRRLNELYDASGRAFRVEEVAGGFQLLSRKRFARWLRRLSHTPAEVRLSAPAMETLAVVAYRQPALRADIEAIRGVNCGEILRQLMERDLVRISGRSEDLGRPYLYSTTRRFLQLFGLRDLDQLPRADLLRVDPAKSKFSDRTSQTDIEQPGEPSKEESNVSVTLGSEPQVEELLTGAAVADTWQPIDSPRAEDDDFDDMDDDDDDDDDYGDDEDDDDDIDDGDDAEEDDVDEDFDDEDDEWEEVEEDEEEDDEEDWDDDDDDWDDDDYDEEEEDEDWD